MFFVLMGCTCAVDVDDASNTEDSNLTNDNALALSQEKLEVSSENSISETNIVNSHEDNLNDYPEDSVLQSSDESYCEDNGEQKLALGLDSVNETVSVSDDSEVLTKDIGDTVVSATKKVKTSLTIGSTHYNNVASFKVTLQDANGNSLKNQKVSLKVKGKTYSGVTNDKGYAVISTAKLAVGSYDATVSYAGNANYSASSLSRKIGVLNSVTGKDLNMVYGKSKYYSATFWKDRLYLKNTTVTYYIGKTKFTSKTNDAGVAVLKINLKPGKYVITAVNPINNENTTNNIVVKKDTTNIKGSSNVYIIENSSYKYSVVLTSSQGKAIKNVKVSFSIANKILTATTDKNGKASVAIPVLKKGTYGISYKFDGNDYYSSSNSSGKICIKRPSNKLIASNLKMSYNDGSVFTVKLTDSSGKALSNKTIKFILNGTKYSSKTNSKGVASLSIGKLKPGTYGIKYSYLSRSSDNYNFGNKKVIISKQIVKFSAKNLVMKYKDGSKFTATVKYNSGKAMKNIAVIFKVNGKEYNRITNSKGVAKLKITLPIGYYGITADIANEYYTANRLSKHILVNGTKFIASDKTVAYSSSQSYSVKLVDGKNKPVKSASVKFKIDGKTYTKKSDSKGVAKVNLGALKAGNHVISYAHGSYKGSSKINVIGKVTLKEVIEASINVRDYIIDKEKLPSSVKIGKLTFSTAEYLYFASKAIVNLNSGKNSDIGIKDVKKPTKPGKSSNLGNLQDYVSVAKSLIKTVDSNGRMPNSVSSSIGDIGYNGVVYAAARVVAFYGEEKIMPNYVVIKTLSSSSSSSTSNVNSKNTISNLAAYLAASTNCQVNNTKIKQLVTKLTKGLTSDKAKAVAIYNYVRDTISYSFYYDTRYGAVGTLDAKTGNCVDHSHLLVAMYRTAGLAARYVHGTCTFSSGTYGHVWTQVLIGDTWVVSDATSARNSFGNIVNWNTNSYSLKGYYASIGF